MLRSRLCFVFLLWCASAWIAAGAEYRYWTKKDGSPVGGERKLIALDGNRVTLEKKDDLSREQIALDSLVDSNVRLIQLWARPERRAAVEWALASGTLQVDDAGRIEVYFLNSIPSDATFRELQRHFPDLYHLECNPTALSEAVWTSIADFKQLGSLTLKLEQPAAAKDGKDWNPRFDVLAQMPALTTLALDGRDFKLADHLPALNAASLKTFKVGYFPLTEKDLRLIAAWPTLRELELRPSLRQDLSLLANLTAAKELTALLLPNSNLTEVDTRHLAKFTRLRRLDFNSLASAGYAEVAKLPELESLNVFGFATENPPQDAEVKHLTRLKKLKSLNIRAAKLTVAGLADVGAMTQLEELILSTKLPPEGLQQLAPLRNLKVLRFSAEVEPTVRLSDILQLLVDRQGRTTQEALHMINRLNPRTGPLDSVQGSPAIDIASARYLVQLPEVHNLILFDGRPDEWLKAFRELRGVRVFSFMATPSFFGSKPGDRLTVSREGFAQLECWDRLEFIFLARCDFVGDALAHFPHPERIKKINFSDCRFPPGNSQALRKFTNLEEFAIGSEDFGGFDLHFLAELKLLKKLLVTEKLSLDALRALKGLSKLERLEVRMTHLAFADIYRLLTEEFGRTPQQAMEMIFIYKRDRAGKLTELEWDCRLFPHTGPTDNMPKFASQDLAVLSKLPALRKLTLPIDLDAAGLEHVQALPELEQIAFRTPTLTEHGLNNALQLKKLKKLIVFDSKLDSAVIVKLRKDHPEVEIELKESFW